MKSFLEVQDEKDGKVNESFSLALTLMSVYFMYKFLKGWLTDHKELVSKMIGKYELWQIKRSLIHLTEKNNNEYKEDDEKIVIIFYSKDRTKYLKFVIDKVKSQLTFGNENGDINKQPFPITEKDIEYIKSKLKTT
jgi:hypothetical protein